MARTGTVIVAQAAIQTNRGARMALDSGFRRNDERLGTWQERPP